MKQLYEWSTRRAHAQKVRKEEEKNRSNHFPTPSRTSTFLGFLMELTTFQAMHTSLKIRRVSNTHLCLVHDISWYIRHELGRIANLGSCL